MNNVELVPFIADSAADAASQVRSRLGPQAGVVHVRPVAGEDRGWFRRRSRPRIEVLAYRPTEVQEPTAGGGTREEWATEVRRVTAKEAERETSPGTVLETVRAVESEPGLSGGGAWRVGGLLESAGIRPAEAQLVVDRLRREHGDRPPSSVGEELALAREVMRAAWREPKPASATGGGVHVLVGASGSGKTTCLSKWLTMVALGEGRAVRVWRLDGQTANTADALAVYCDVLGVPLARRWAEGDGVDAGEVGFVDLPGVDWQDAAALARLAKLIRGLRSARVHLVLNAAYDTSLMLRQVRAFGLLRVEDLVVTHLDEEARWGKIWNLLLGTNYSVRFLSAGQNVPGDFQMATPEVLLARLFPG